MKNLQGSVFLGDKGSHIHTIGNFISILAQALCLKNFNYDKALKLELNNGIILIGKGAYLTFQLKSSSRMIKMNHVKLEQIVNK